MSNNLLWLALWSVLLLLIGSLRGRLLEHHVVKVLLLPGLCFDACIRLITCLVTATPIKGLHPFARGKPFLDTEPRDIGFPLQVLSVGIRLSILYCATYWLLMDFPRFLDSSFALPTLHASAESLGASSIGHFTAGVGNMVSTLSLGSLTGFLLVYTLLGALVASALQREEFMAATAVWLLILGVGWGLDYLGVTFRWFSTGFFIRWLYFEEFYATFSLLVFLSLLAAVILGLRRPGLRLLASFSSKGAEKG